MSDREQGPTRDPRDPAGPRTPEDLARSGRFAARDAGTSPVRFAGLGFQLLASILLFLYLGKWLDRKLGTSPWLLMVGVFLGAGAGFYSMYRQLTAAQRAEDREAARRHEERG